MHGLVLLDINATADRSVANAAHLLLLLPLLLLLLQVLPGAQD
jgi:hypothetical protein